MGQQQWCGQPSAFQSQISQLKRSHISFKQSRSMCETEIKLPEIVLSVRNTLGKLKTLKTYPRGKKQGMIKMEKKKKQENLSKKQENITKEQQNTIKEQGIIYYEGEWVGNVVIGLGQIYFSDGSIYQGYLMNGIPQGEGRYICSNGVYYEGEVSQGSAHGFGLLVNHHKNYSLSGQWKDDLPHGYCKEIFGFQAIQCQLSFDPEQSMKPKVLEHLYEGQFVHGLKEGQGHYKCGQQYQYWGQFKNNMMWGKGKIIFATQSYEGEFKHNLYEGKGKYQWQDGTTFIGQWHQGQKHGQGHYISHDKKGFCGTFYHGKREGKGAVYSSRGEKSEDIWNNNHRMYA